MNKHFPIFLFGFICCFSVATSAQSAMDTIKDCLKKEPHLFGKFDTRNSFIDNSRAKVWGAKIGLNYGNRLQFGFGYNQLYSSAANFDKQVYYSNINGITEHTTAKLHLYYFSIHTEYIYYQTKHWQLSIPLQLGVGETYYKYQTMGLNKLMERNTVFIYEPSVSIEYKLIKWFGIGADIGFRFMATDYKRLNQKFNSPTYAFKFLIYYNEIVKSFLKKGKKRKK